MDASITPAEFLRALWHLAEFNTSSERVVGKLHRQPVFRNKEFTSKFLATLTDTEWQLLEKFGVDNYKKPNPPNQMIFAAIPRAAAIAFAVLLKEKHILTNPYALSTRLPTACASIGLYNIYNLKSSSMNSSFLSMITSTTVKKIEDIPSNITDFITLRRGLNISAHLKNLVINYPTEENGLQPFDLSRIDRRTIQKPNEQLVGTAEWFRAQGFNEVWIEFSQICINEGNAGYEQTRGILKHFINWAGARFSSPWYIKSVDLRDPYKPTNPDTFFAFLSQSDRSTNCNIWTRVASLLKRAANHLNTPGYPGYTKGVTRVNPFQNIENPFKSYRNGNKTHRARISTTLHDMLIEVLLSPDKNGKPTFKWAKEASKKHFNTVDFLPDGTWCPSRWTALAVLLLLPIRKKQVRWLDQGLMDEFIFDPDTFTMVENTHYLRNFRYEDRQSHIQRYGRPTGTIKWTL
ncbi:MAG: hypothetical protein JRG71_16040 [Deltaproteobacteria bacterium]|nr:hypothetical protein [Deltaproteobacteria bacterium]